MRCPDPRYVWPKGKVIAVPCGKCLACLSNRRNDWAIRLMNEYRVSDSAFFVTLTYSDKFYPDSGLSKRHVQLYMKRLRKVTPRLRYYAVGEYGTKTGRAHYHAIIFNAEERHIRSAWSLYNSVRKVQEPIGIVHVGTVTEASVTYVLKYIVQQGGEIPGLSKPFSLMSRAYGLGLNYLTDAMVAWHRAGDRVYMINCGSKRRLPRYYKDKIWPDGSYKQKEEEKGLPKRYWSDWYVRRENLLKKAQKEAEIRDELENDILFSMGFLDPEAIRADARDAVISRIKSKVAFSQKF